MHTDAMAQDAIVPGMIAKRCKLLGVRAAAGTLQQAVEEIGGWIKKREGHHNVIVANVHLLTEAHRNPKLFEAFEQASLAVTDGMPLVWLARRKMPQAERIVGIDLMVALCKNGGRIFLLGGAEGVADALGRKLCADYPGTILAGTASPPFRACSEEEEATLVAQINAAQPDILFVALGAPKQELWIHKHKAALNVPAIIGVGAAFDYALGRIARAPHWMQACGLEWFYRFMQEPRRLFKRYATSNAHFIWLVLKQYSTLRPLAEESPQNAPRERR